ncbi:MAG: tol-pal system-associated acyl-CoA thioesterase [Betaproteobacteria bacterium]|nr:tol-pal system-associated acyl-CoA thioesterase [Betaproteobacteria bacterium]
MNSSEKLATRHSSPLTAPFSWPIRVYYEDTDSGGVVYYANYLKFLERARTEWLRALGFTQRELAGRERVVFVVRSLAIEYMRPSWFDDSLQVTVEPVKVGAGQMVVAQQVARAAEVLATAQVRLACVNAATFKPVRIPRAITIRTGTIS